MAVKVRMIEIDTTYQQRQRKKRKKDKSILELKKIYDAMMKRETNFIKDDISKDILRILEGINQ